MFTQPPVSHRVLNRFRRLWMLEHCARNGLLIAGITADLLLACLVLHRLAGVSRLAMACGAVLGLVAIASLVVTARLRAPKAHALARLLDDRCGTNDLFASSLEFQRSPERFGWLGELTCQYAAERATAVRIRPQWALGNRRPWTAIAVGAVVLGLSLAGLELGAGRGAPPNPFAPGDSPGANGAAAPTRARVEEKAADTHPAQEATKLIEDAPTPPPSADTAVKITNEMIDKYLAAMPSGPQEIDMTGVTPARWDADEVSGKNDPRRESGEKIDPVKLDAAMLKDLETAKKTKVEGGKDDAGVTVAVMADSARGAKAKGDKGGSGDSLANAVSKDPRGEASRLAVKPARKGLQVVSVGRSNSRQRGEDRPMGLLDFLSAMEQLKRLGLDPLDAALPETAAEAKDNVVRPDDVSEGAAALTDAYFEHLRKADR
jgi:hypothetical protein